MKLATVHKSWYGRGARTIPRSTAPLASAAWRGVPVVVTPFPPLEREHDRSPLAAPLPRAIARYVRR